MGSQHHLMVFCSALQAGGAERVLSILSTPFADHYKRVTYLMWQDAPVFYQIDNRVELVSVARSCKGSVMQRMRWLRSYVQKTKPDLLLSFSAPFNMLALFALLGTKQQVIVAERVDPRSFRWGRCMEWLRNRLYAFADGILVQTEHSRGYFRGKLLAKTHVIYNPVVMDAVRVGAAVNTEKHSCIVTAARLEKQKQHDLLIRVFARFKKSYPTYRLVIYGTGSELTYLQSYANDCGVSDSVQFPGTVSNLWDCMLPANMFVMTSLFEGMSNALIEAMCLGLPCISSKVSGATDLIVDGENGYLIDIGDEERLYEYMCCLAKDCTLANRMGREAAQLYHNLEVGVIAGEWLSYLDQKIVENGL